MYTMAIRRLMRSHKIELERFRDQAKTDGALENCVGWLKEILTTRGITAIPEERGRIEACTDFVEFRRWLRNASTADNMDEVLATQEFRPAWAYKFEIETWLWSGPHYPPGKGPEDYGLAGYPAGYSVGAPPEVYGVVDL
jgi:hypothetical protein